MDDTTNVAKELRMLLNSRIGVKIYTDLRPLLEILGSTSQVAEKAVQQSVPYLKQFLEDKDLYA